MKKPNYAIHTFEVRRYLKQEEYKVLRDTLFEKSKNNFRAYTDGLETVFDIFDDEGIRTRLIRHDQRPYLALIVNLKAIEQSGNLIDLISSGDEFTNSYHIADKMITDFFGEEYALDKLELCRIDFSVNIDVGSRENVKTYIHILNHRAGVPRGYKIKGRKCKEIDLSKGYLADNKNAGVSLSIYDKEAQLIDINKSDCAAKAENILRIEFQLRRHKVVEEFTPGCYSNFERIEYCIKSSEEVIKQVLSKFMMDCTYYTLEDARKVVNAEIENKKLCKRMIRRLELTANKHSKVRGLEALLKEDPKISSRYIIKMEKTFREIDVNIVTTSKKYKSVRIPSLMEFL